VPRALDTLPFASMRSLIQHKVFCLPVLAWLILSDVPGAAQLPVTLDEQITSEQEVAEPIVVAETPGPSYQEPCTGPDDWVRLNSSEWLKGDLRWMRNKTLEFKSKKLKAQTLKWKDVVEVCLPGLSRFVREDNSVAQGIGHVRYSEVVVVTAMGEVKFGRHELIAILPGGARELDRWSLIASLGVDANVGNTEQTSLTASVEVRRDARETRFNSGYYGSYGTASGEENVNRQRILGKFDWFLKRQFYVTLLDGAVVYDKFQNIQNRTIIGSGIGYWVIDWETLEWELEAGAAYQYTQNISVEFGQDPSSNDFAIRLSTYFKWDITGDLKFDIRHDSYLVATDFGLTTNFTRMKGSYEITDLLNLEVTFVHSRVQDPVPLADGTVPKPNDYQLVIGFGLELY
jgi:hypothetical protein